MDTSNKPVYYCNITSINTNIYDFQFMFGLKKDREKPDIVEGDIECKIVMSPQHAKALAGVLNGATEFYEKNFGKIELEQKVDELKQPV